MIYTNEEILMLSIGALGLGMYLLFKGGNWTIDSAVYIAKNFGISPLVIGFTIVAFGTSLPELIVSINANLTGSSGIAIGNVIGFEHCEYFIGGRRHRIFCNVACCPT